MAPAATRLYAGAAAVKRWAPPRTVKPMVKGMLAFAGGLVLALLLTPRWDAYVLVLALVGALALPFLASERAPDRARLRRWLILLVVGVVLGTLGSLAHRYGQGDPDRSRGGESAPRGPA